MTSSKGFGRIALPLLVVSAAACASEGAASGDDSNSLAQAQQALRPAAAVNLLPLGTYESGLFAQSAAEITAHDPATQRLFVVNATNGRVDVLDIQDPTAPTKISSIDLSSIGGGANSVATHNGLVAVAVEAYVKQDPGTIAFFDADGNLINTVPCGALPDMIKFTHNGEYVLTANEGEPNSTYTVDPEGSVTIVSLANGVENLTVDDVKTADFRRFTRADLDPSVRIFGPNATVAQDLEPEYIAVSHNSKTAWVTLQENNAMAIIDIKEGVVTDVVGLGFKNHNLPGNGLDASDRDNAINIQQWPVRGVFMPDGIAAVHHKGETYLLTANEGDAREYGSFVEEVRIADASYVLDPVAFPNAATLKQNANLGRLRATRASGDLDHDGDYDQIHVFGARSMTVWNSKAQQVADTGDEFERITAAEHPANFNASNDNNTFDARSPAKGPEPETITVGKIKGRTYSFVGLERISAIVVYDVSDPTQPKKVGYINNRDFSQPVNTSAAGDLGPEGVLFIEAEDSPNGKPILAVGNEVSGSVSLYEVEIE